MVEKPKSKNQPEKIDLKKHWLWLPTSILLVINLSFLISSFLPFNPDNRQIVLYPLQVYGAPCFGSFSYILMGICFLFASSKKPLGIEHNRLSKILVLVILILNLPLTCYTLTIQTREIQYFHQQTLETYDGTYQLTYYKPDECYSYECYRLLVYECEYTGTLCRLIFVSDRLDRLGQGEPYLLDTTKYTEGIAVLLVGNQTIYVVPYKNE